MFFNQLQSQIRQKLFDSSLSLRSMMIGEDRYRRRYWVLPQCGGIFVEGMENGEGANHNWYKGLKSLFFVSAAPELILFIFLSGYEEEKNEEERRRPSQAIVVKEEQQRTAKAAVFIPGQNTESYGPSVGQQNEDNLFLQNPGSLSNLSKLLEVVKIAQKSQINAQTTHSAESPASYPSYSTSQTDKTDTSISSLLGAPQLKNGHWMTHSPQTILHHDQLSKVLMENGREWFSLLPRSPCDRSSVTSDCNPPASPSPQPIRTEAPSFLLPNPPETGSYNSTAGINNIKSPMRQVGGFIAVSVTNIKPDMLQG